MMERGTGFPCRVYSPGTDTLGTAHAVEASGVLVHIDGTPDDERVYFPPVSLVEVVLEDASGVELINGTLVLRGSAEIGPGETLTLNP